MVDVSLAEDATARVNPPPEGTEPPGCPPNYTRPRGPAPARPPPFLPSPPPRRPRPGQNITDPYDNHVLPENRSLRRFLLKAPSSLRPPSNPPARGKPEDSTCPCRRTKLRLG